MVKNKGALGKEVKKRKKIFVDIEKDVLKWAIESAGFENKEISKKISEKESIINDWFEGKNKPTLKQLENLAHIVKRPLASLLLPKPPEEKPLPKDFRMLPNKEGKFDKKTIFAIRKARNLQESCKELSIYLNEEVKSKIERASLKDKPEIMAERYRKLFNLTEKTQTKFKSHYEFYNYLREKLEDINIFPFQISMPLEDARGFALSDNEPFVIVVNSGDMIEARVFTIMHEFGHILLRETGIDIPNFTSNNEIEKWCNEFSSSFLLPKEIAKDIFNKKRNVLTRDETLKSISNRYNVSKAMILYNMVKFGFINWGKFNEILNRYKLPSTENISIGIPIERKRLSEIGGKFISLVAGNLDKKNITYSDALGYLSVKSGKLDKVLGRAKT